MASTPSICMTISNIVKFKAGGVTLQANNGRRLTIDTMVSGHSFPVDTGASSNSASG